MNRKRPSASEAQDILPHQYIVSFLGEPAALHNTYQTIREPFNTTACHIADFEAEALALLASIEAAADEERLGLHKCLNVVTGECGLIIAGSRKPRQVEMTTVVGELLTDCPRELDDVVKQRFDYLGWLARQQNLSVVAHANGPGGHRVAFAALVRRVDGELRFDYRPACS